MKKIVHTPTKKDLKKVIKKAFKQGIYWSNGDKIIRENDWDRYKEKTVVFIRDDLTYQDISWAQEIYPETKIISTQMYLEDINVGDMVIDYEGYEGALLGYDPVNGLHVISDNSVLFYNVWDEHLKETYTNIDIPLRTKINWTKNITKVDNKPKEKQMTPTGNYSYTQDHYSTTGGSGFSTMTLGGRDSNTITLEEVQKMYGNYPYEDEISITTPDELNKSEEKTMNKLTAKVIRTFSNEDKELYKAGLINERNEKTSELKEMLWNDMMDEYFKTNKKTYVELAKELNNQK